MKPVKKTKQAPEPKKSPNMPHPVRRALVLPGQSRVSFKKAMEDVEKVMGDLHVQTTANLKQGRLGR